MILPPGSDIFRVEDLYRLGELVSSAWAAAADRDWSAPAGTLEWSCLHTADHAVDCVYAPAFFLASRKLDAYPVAGNDQTLGPLATPERIIESLGLATRLLAAVVKDAPAEVEAVIFRRPTILTGRPVDFVPRAALELIIHAHDVCQGVELELEPPPELCHRLREHTFSWPLWNLAGRPGLERTDDPWGDLLRGYGRNR